ncbi:phosphoribosylanthranilate isomerase [Nocardia takedensis]|uniref:phosphoribosylanthranilate isomerase n=1 Tax=Nocardia takedensis TaxID=259390 RepID=UPI000592C1FC|nr:phosphoribosylanthranilate isomerase [Nocardia takedensis]
MTVRAKICGIRSDSDLRLAVAAGADAVGFISGTTHFSEDSLSGPEATRLSALVPPFVTRVLVTHLEDAAAIVDLADEIGVDAIQVHGLVALETVGAVRAAAGGRKVLRAVHVTGPDALEAAEAAAEHCDAVLLDSRTDDRLGGTGLTHDWSISARIVASLAGVGCPVVLAGGLNAENVGTAIAEVHPFAVDVNSGVEDAEGNKAARACRDFVATAHDSPVSTTSRSLPH